MNTKTIPVKIKVQDAMKTVAKMMKDRHNDLNPDSIYELDAYLENLDTDYQEGLDEIKLDDFVSELTDILIDGQ